MLYVYGELRGASVALTKDHWVVAEGKFSGALALYSSLYSICGIGTKDARSSFCRALRFVAFGKLPSSNS